MKSFDCPNCGAPLDYEDGSEATFRCQYCQKNVIVPPELRLKREITISTIAPGRKSRTRSLTCILVVIALVVVLIGTIPVFIILSAANKAEFKDGSPFVIQLPTSITKIVIISTPKPKPSPTSGFVSLALKFGGEGIGPGLLNDSRSIAVDGAGNIYVGDYEGGRIQVFNSQGVYVTQWNYGKDAYLMGLTADYTGIVYVVIYEGIYKFEGLTGKSMGYLDFPDSGFDDAYATPDGGILTSIYTGEDDIVRFNRNGKVILTIKSAISDQTGDSELSMKVVEDGSGNIYTLGTFNEAVFKFSSQGKFLNRIGGEGDQPGQFRAVEDIAVDGQGRIYVSDIHGIQIFDSEGRYLDVIFIEGAPFGLVFNIQNELLVSNRDYVYKFVLTEP